MAKAPVVPELKCECGHDIPIEGKRIGDSVPCPRCQRLQVVLRSRVSGPVMPAQGAPGTISDRLPEVQESLERIRLRKAGHAARDVALYPPLSVFAVGAFGFYLSAILAGQNLVALGYPQRGRRVQVLGVTLYIIIATALLLLSIRFPNVVPGGSQTLLGIALGCLLAGALAPMLIGLSTARAAFEAGAKAASPLLPILFGFLLGVAQLFVFKFVDLASSW